MEEQEKNGQFKRKALEACICFRSWKVQILSEQKMKRTEMDVTDIRERERHPLPMLEDL